MSDYQSRVREWAVACLGDYIATNSAHRNHRFLEEALELVQAAGCSADEAHAMVDYVYGRPPGEVSQEVGGVMVTLAAFCAARNLDMEILGEAEWTRCWDKIEEIRKKQALKPNALAEMPWDNWHNEVTGETEYRRAPQTDAEAVQYLPQSPASQGLYRIARQQGESVLQAMRTVLSASLPKGPVDG